MGNVSKFSLKVNAHYLQMWWVDISLKNIYWKMASLADVKPD